MRLAAAVLAFTALASAEERTITLTNPATPRNLQEIATVLRTVGDIPNLTVNAEHPAFTFQGTPAQLDTAAWLIQHLDKPAGWQPSDQEKQNPSTREYRVPSTARGNVLRISYLPEATTPRGIQETLTILRTVLDIQKVFNYTPLHALVYRGTASEVDAVEWILPALDTRAVSEIHPLPDGVPADLVRVFPLPQDATNQQSQQLVTTLRSKPIFIQKVFTQTSPPAIAVRGTATQLDQAQQLISPTSR